MSGRKLRLGDPYGNRTRVSAVEPESPVESTPVAVLAALYASHAINDLQGSGQESRLAFAINHDPMAIALRSPAGDPSASLFTVSPSDVFGTARA